MTTCTKERDPVLAALEAAEAATAALNRWTERDGREKEDALSDASAKADEALIRTDAMTVEGFTRKAAYLAAKYLGKWADDLSHDGLDRLIAKAGPWEQSAALFSIARDAGGLIEHASVTGQKIGMAESGKADGAVSATADGVRSMVYGLEDSLVKIEGLYGVVDTVMEHGGSEARSGLVYVVDELGEELHRFRETYNDLHTAAGGAS